ncbi:MAG: hypothetical protein AAF501_17720 [Pseudomonadota bacterium]
MRKTLMILGLGAVFLAVIDLGVAGMLALAERTGRAEGLVRYFDYGRSVPGKLALWQAEPDRRDNLFRVAWRPQSLERSRAAFSDEPVGQTGVLRSYGMSFVANIVRAAQRADPELVLDRHGGPAAPPNLTFALFEDDRENRRPGDTVILGILSSSVPAMAAFSNRSWAFEQPAPLTYPIYLPEADGLVRIEPLIESEAEERALLDDPQAAAAWEAQMAAEDAFHSPITFGGRIFDHSPLLRLIRRSLARSFVDRTKAGIVEDRTYPYGEVLRRMIRQFSATARADGQTPIVLLIQGRDRRDPDLLDITRPALEADLVPYLATAQLYDPRDLAGFKPDGHYKREVDAVFGAELARMVRTLNAGGAQ